MLPIELLDQQLKLVCPIDGVSIGRWSDKTTWQITFRPEATAAERARAQTVLTAFDPAQVPAPIDRGKRKADLAGATTIADLKAVLQDLL